LEATLLSKEETVRIPDVEVDSALVQHIADHSFVEFGMGAGSDGDLPHGSGGQLTVLLPAPTRPNLEDSADSETEVQAEAPGDAALAAAEAAFVAVRSLAFAPLAGTSPSLVLNSTGPSASGGARAAVIAAAASAGTSSTVGRAGLRRGT
jgi:hypothetical protein